MSIVLPVHNVQTSLPRLAFELLDALADFNTQFEVVIVDDGSTDHTEETALELALRYPQLRVCRMPQRSGVAAAVERGMAVADGDIVLVVDSREPMRVSNLRRLWELRNQGELISAGAATPPTIEPRLLKQLSSWGAAVKRLAAEQDRHGGMHMIRRQAVGDLAQTGAGAEVAVSEIRRTDRVRRNPAPAQRPSFLGHLKQLALGE